MKKRKTQLKKYHPRWTIVKIVLWGIFWSAVSILLGIWIAHGIGILFRQWGACPDYFSDFLGGALGLLVGFILDVFFIQMINHVCKYINLMRVVKNELEGIKDESFMNNAEILTTNNEHDEEDRDKKSKKVREKLCVKSKPIESGTEEEKVSEIVSFSEDELECREIEKNKELKAKYDELKSFYIPYEIHEYILDDLVKNAETMSILANLPMAKHYSIEFINCLSLIHKCIMDYSGCIKEFKEKLSAHEVHDVPYEMRGRWLLLQFNINKVIEVL